ncbi:MAG: oligosaccharide flippase family protein, partial [Candidatus Pacearchaeota archaeon]|nr:oligosaccharide flippase family protein [Candidatus Pacearchaeota archaeon]
FYIRLRQRFKMEKKTTQTAAQQAVTNSFYQFILSLINKLGSLIFTILIARLMFPELFGLYNLALTIILLIATLTDLGLNSTLIRYLAESLKKKTEKTKQEARSRLYFLLNIKIFLTALVAFLLFVLSGVIATHLFGKSDLAQPLQIGSVYLFVISVQGFFGSVFYSLKKINYPAISELIFQISRIALVLMMFLFYKSVSAIFISLSIALFVSLVFLYLSLHSQYGFLLQGPRTVLEKQEKKRMLSFFGWLTISSISLIFFMHLDMLMLGFFVPAEFIGYYSAIINLINSMGVFLVFGAALLPIFTQLAQGRLEQGFKKVFRYVSLVAIPLAIALAYLAPAIIRVIFGQAYVPSQYQFEIMLTAAIFSFIVIETSLTGIYSAAFQAKEKPKIPSVIVIISTILNIILCYFFIKIGISISIVYSLVGVAAATFLARYLNLIALAIFAKKRLNISGRAMDMVKPLIASIVMLSFMLVFDYFVIISIFTGMLMIIAAVLIYLLVMLLIKGIKKGDSELLMLLFKK